MPSDFQMGLARGNPQQQFTGQEERERMGNYAVPIPVAQCPLAAALPHSFLELSPGALWSPLCCLHFFKDVIYLR